MQFVSRAQEGLSDGESRDYEKWRFPWLQTMVGCSFPQGALMVVPVVEGQN